MKVNFLVGILVGILLSYAVAAVSSYFNSSNATSSSLVVGIGGGPPVGNKGSGKTDADVLAQNGNFNIFLDALGRTGLMDKISGPDTYTIFAPSDKAFSKIPQDLLYALMSDRDALRILLMHHIVLGDVTPQKLAEGVKTLDGTTIKATNDGSLKIQGTQVNATIKTSNGTIYTIDDFIMPPDFLFKQPLSI